MSDLTATNCGCNNNSCSNNNNCSNGIFGNSCIWIILYCSAAVAAVTVAATTAADFWEIKTMAAAEMIVANG